MSSNYLLVEQSNGLKGQVELSGAKNAVLVIMASLILAEGKSRLTNVPNSADVHQMIEALKTLGADISYNPEHATMEVDTTHIRYFSVGPEIMNKMRASILVMGPLLARFGKAHVAVPGGCQIGARPIDYHVRAFARMGVHFDEVGHYLNASLDRNNVLFQNRRIILEYPSVGATENSLMLATLLPGTTTIVNAALEPEVLDLIDVLTKMGAMIDFELPQCIRIVGVSSLKAIDHDVMPDRLEAGSLMLATAVAGGELYLPDARPFHMEVFLEKLREMGHEVYTEYRQTDGTILPGIYFKAHPEPKAVSFKTSQYPGFPTDLQAPMMVAQTLALGESVIEETVFENRMMHVKELVKMGANITLDGTRARVRGVDQLYGCQVIATDIRASCGLVVAGLAAVGQTHISGIHHWKRGYDKLDLKLRRLGAQVTLVEEKVIMPDMATAMMAVV